MIVNYQIVRIHDSYNRVEILELSSRLQNEACGNGGTWNKIDTKFEFCIKFYARINFRLLGPTKLFLWLFIITRFFKNYMDFPYENKSGGNFPPSSFLYLEAI